MDVALTLTLSEKYHVYNDTLTPSPTYFQGIPIILVTEMCFPTQYTIYIQFTN